MLASPLTPPPPLASIHAGAMAIAEEGKPELSPLSGARRHVARLSALPRRGRRDRPARDPRARLVGLVRRHARDRPSARREPASRRSPSTRAATAPRERAATSPISASSTTILPISSPSARQTYPKARLTLIGHSSGGGFALRIAAGPLGELFDRFVLLSPYLGYRAPTNRPSEGAGRWAAPDIPRIVAIMILRTNGNRLAAIAPAIAFANAPDAAMVVTSRYSFRLMVNYGPPRDWKGALRAAAGRIELIAGENDELMDAAAYQSVVAPLGVARDAASRPRPHGGRPRARGARRDPRGGDAIGREGERTGQWPGSRRRAVRRSRIRPARRVLHSRADSRREGGDLRLDPRHRRRRRLAPAASVSPSLGSIS